MVCQATRVLALGMALTTLLAARLAIAGTIVSVSFEVNEQPCESAEHRSRRNSPA
jgi:hypothetical protein